MRAADRLIDKIETLGDRLHRVEAERDKLWEAGEALADAVRALDSYAASSQVAPLERTERADAALKRWEALDEIRPP